MWNARELASVTGEDELLADVDALVPLIEDRWDADLRPGRRRSRRVDVGPDLARPTHRVPCSWSTTRTNGLQAVAPLADSADHGGAPGPAAFTRPSRCTTRRPTGGGRWPQLAYLLWRAPIRDPAETEVGEEFGDELAGAVRQGSPSTGTAIRPPEAGDPQSWTGLALVLAKTRTTSPSSSMRPRIPHAARRSSPSFLRLVPPEGLKTRKRGQAERTAADAGPELRRTSAIPTRVTCQVAE